eukprot:748819-Hanusia_phi.AAC.2
MYSNCHLARAATACCMSAPRARRCARDSATKNPPYTQRVTKTDVTLELTSRRRRNGEEAELHHVVEDNQGHDHVAEAPKKEALHRNEVPARQKLVLDASFCKRGQLADLVPAGHRRQGFLCIKPFRDRVGDDFCLGRLQQLHVGLRKSPHAERLPFHTSCGVAPPLQVRSWEEEEGSHRALPLDIGLQFFHNHHLAHPPGCNEVLKVGGAENAAGLRVRAHARTGVDRVPKQAVEPSRPPHDRSCKWPTRYPHLCPKRLSLQAVKLCGLSNQGPSYENRLLHATPLVQLLMLGDVKRVRGARAADDIRVVDVMVLEEAEAVNDAVK